MRKFIITLTIIALIISIVGTGVIVYFESSTNTADTASV